MNFRRGRSVSLLFLILYACVLSAQDRTFSFITYNVENLYDTLPAAHGGDQEFLPHAERKWTSSRLYRKVHQLAQVISDASGVDIPALIALQEVENDLVLDLLCRTTLLRATPYRYIRTTGSDARGAQVALIYDSDRLQVLNHEEWPLYITSDSIYPTRHLLHVECCLPSHQLLSVIVCHLPSQRGGAIAQDARNRILAMLEERTRKLYEGGARSILVLGDFNEYRLSHITAPWASLLREGGQGSRIMVDVTPPYADYQSKEMPPGSYYYQGYWESIDRIYVSRDLLTGELGKMLDLSSLRVYWPSSRYLFSTPAPWGRPRRTYGGTTYLGGPSDHLPLVGSFRYISGTK